MKQKQTPFFAVPYYILAVVFCLLTACQSSKITRHPTYPGSFPSDTQLTISSEGNFLVVSWYDDNNVPHARLLTLNGTQLISDRPLELPPHKFTIAFGYKNEELLVTTHSKEGSSLIKLNVLTGERQLITHSAQMKRFPLEDKPGSYVFLEAGEAIKDMHTWQRWRRGSQQQINPFGFKIAAPLNIIGDSLFIFIAPARYPMMIQGRIPPEVLENTDKDTFNIQCADTNPIVCIKDTLLFKPLPDGRSYGVASIFSKDHHCTIQGEWFDKFGFQISRNGRLIAFHAADPSRSGPRSLQVIDTQEAGCNSHEIKPAWN